MALVPSTFRQQFPEFKDPAIYSDAVLAFWDSVALIRLIPDTWGDLFAQGEALFVAHHLVLAARNLLASQAGGAPGQLQGVLSSKAIDKVSASYDVNAVTQDTPAFWNQTSYGASFWNLANLVGMGAIQLGVVG